MAEFVFCLNKKEPTNEIIKTNQTLVIDLIEVNTDRLRQSDEEKNDRKLYKWQSGAG